MSIEEKKLVNRLLRCAYLMGIYGEPEDEFYDWTKKINGKIIK